MYVPNSCGTIITSSVSPSNKENMDVHVNDSGGLSNSHLDTNLSKETVLFTATTESSIMNMTHIVN